jgi:hypothetical protein
MWRTLASETSPLRQLYSGETSLLPDLPADPLSCRRPFCWHDSCCDDDPDLLVGVEEKESENGNSSWCRVFDDFSKVARGRGAWVARWYIFEPKIQIWVNFVVSCNKRCSYILCPFGLSWYFCIHFGIFYGHLVNFSRFGILHQEKSGNHVGSVSYYYDIHRDSE